MMGSPCSSLRWPLPRSHHADNHNTNSTLDSGAGPGGGEAEIAAPQPSEILDHPNPPPSTSATRAPRLFALVIGIDGYVRCRGLSGAVADAKAMNDYLRESLGVPEDRIRILLDRQATRSAIIKAFQDIQTDERIKNGDPIVIFFAGHGGEGPPPKTWFATSTIQYLFPCDYEDNCIIPGRTIGALLDRIAEVKGNNICVIFDCCYLAGCARDKDEEYVPRTVEFDLTIPEDLDHDIWRGRIGAIPDGFAYHGFRSHVLLAACGEHELAYEHGGRGQFTAALLGTLKNCIADTSLTYAQVFERVSLDKQNPHCVGINQHRMLFDVRTLAGMQVRHPVEVHGECEYVVGAGLAHGVSRGVEFTLYDAQQQILGVAVPIVDAIQDFRTTITTSEHLSLAAFAKMTRAGEVSLYLAPGASTSAALQGALQRMVDNESNVPNYRFVEEAKEAKLQVGMENDLATFMILDQQVKNFGLTQLPRAATLDNAAHVIRAATHYYWYLHLTNTNIRPGADGAVTVDFYRLKRVLDDFEGFDLINFELPLLQPIRPGLRAEDPTGPIDFVVDPSVLYGIEIKNNTPRDLYMNVFLFNNSSLSIVPCYIQSSAGKPEAPLKPFGTFTIGHGSGPTAPLRFSLEDGQDIDIAHLKIFVATQAVDLTDIVQLSPFLGVDAYSLIDGRGRDGSMARDGGVARETPTAHDIWFTLTIPVVQRRAPEGVIVAAE